MNLHFSRLTLELKWRDWAYQHLRLRSGLPTAPLKPHSKINESLFYESILKQSFSNDELQGVTHWVDVGCRNWGYLPGCLNAFPKLQMGVGVERDPGRIYWNGYYRGDYAQAAAKQACSMDRKIQFVAADFKALTPLETWGDPNDSPAQSRLITHFFPFVSDHPCIQWGLPTEYAHFTPLAKHTLDLLKISSKDPRVNQRWLSLHQGDWEADEARKIWLQLGCRFTEKRIHPDEFRGNWPGRHPLYLFSG